MGEVDSAVGNGVESRQLVTLQARVPVDNESEHAGACRPPEQRARGRRDGIVIKTFLEFDQERKGVS